MAFRTRVSLQRAAGLLTLSFVPPLVSGCLAQTSYTLAASHPHIPTAEELSAPERPRNAREWLRRFHEHTKQLLRPSPHESLLTEDLVDAQRKPVDVLRHFGVYEPGLQSIWSNFNGLVQSARATGPDTTEGMEPEPWPGFEEVWIPVGDGLEIYGRLGLAKRDGVPIDADCVIVLPGLLGDLNVMRTRDLVMALRDSGIHALAVELRGMGRTNERYPDVYCTFGVLESVDLMRIAAWLQARPEIRETGLVGFCWGANHVLVAAWDACRDADDPTASPRLRPFLQPRPAEPLFRAGVLVFSPTLRFEEIIEQCDHPRSLLSKPVYNRLQAGLRTRMAQKHHDGRPYSLGDLIQCEFDRSPVCYPQNVTDSLQFLRLMDHRGMPSGDKFEKLTMPVVIVQGATDGLTSAQYVADVIAETDNENVAAIVLPGGGHIGFAPYAASHYYSIVLGFFDPHSGAAALIDRGAGDRRSIVAAPETAGR